MVDASLGKGGRDSTATIVVIGGDKTEEGAEKARLGRK